MFDAYAQKVLKVLEDPNVQNLRSRVRKIKEYSIDRLDELIKICKDNLEDQGINFHLAKNSDKVKEIVFDLVPENEKIVKSKSNTVNEVGLVDKIKKRNEIVETDCGDFLVNLLEKDSVHPVLPALGLKIEEVVKTIEKKFGIKLKDEIEIANFVRNYLQENILNSRIGISGSNAISSDGGIFVLENEGNITWVTMREKLIIISGIEKIVPSFEDAILICKAQSLFGIGKLPSRINVITSPTGTADIPNVYIQGMHGPKEIHLILVDNGRSKIAKSDLKETLYCINCGACLYFCPVYRFLLNKFGFKYFGGIGLAKVFMIWGFEKCYENGLFNCLTCKACKEVCPLEIDVSELIKRIRYEVIKNVEVKEHKEMVENIRKFGNPFGKEVKHLEKLYCC